MADDTDGFRHIFDDPETRALLSVAAIAGFFAFAGKTLSSSKGRKSYFEQVKQAKADRRERDAWHQRDTNRIKAKWDFWEKEGNNLWAQRALVTIGPEEPFADAIYERLQAGFRHARFRVSSRCAGARLEVGWDVADKLGGLSMTLDDSRKWGFDIWAAFGGIRQYQVRNTLPDIEMARLACRLLATPRSDFSTITLIKPESGKIREQIWRDHLATHPELVREEWPW